MACAHSWVLLIEALFRKVKDTVLECGKEIGLLAHPLEQQFGGARDLVMVILLLTWSVWWLRLNTVDQGPQGDNEALVGKLQGIESMTLNLYQPMLQLTKLTNHKQIKKAEAFQHDHNI